MIPSQTTQAERPWNPRGRLAYARESVTTRPKWRRWPPAQLRIEAGIVATMLEQLDARSSTTSNVRSVAREQGGAARALQVSSSGGLGREVGQLA
jgi:hypothetical protein